MKEKRVVIPKPDGKRWLSPTENKHWRSHCGSHNQSGLAPLTIRWKREKPFNLRGRESIIIYKFHNPMQAKLVADVTVKVELTGIMPLSFGKHHDEPHVSNEKESAYEVRTYREKLHFNDQGEIFVPAMMAKKSLDAAVKHKGDKIAGRGKATYTKYFETGCRVLEDFPLTFNGSPITKDSVPYEKLFVPSDGVAGSGKRVNKWFPKIDIGWQCTGEFLILNNIIDPDTFVRMLKYAGTFIGLGRWRIQNAGNYGMFVPTSIIWNGKVLI